MAIDYFSVSPRKATLLSILFLTVLILFSVFFYLLGNGSLTRKVNRAVLLIERERTWEQELETIETELSYYNDWFDSVSILSTWLYQNTRVGDQDFNIEFTFEKDLNKWNDSIKTRDAKWFWEINNSDTVISFCGDHCNFATRFYEYFGIKSYNLSIRNNPTESNSMNGHMINVIQNPHNRKWYPIDHFFGIRWRHNGELLDMETYKKLSNEQLCLIDVESFGTFKFHIRKSPFDATWSYCYDPIEIALVEATKHPKYYRIMAPFTLRKTIPHYKPSFDSIAASYGMPPHVDWIDLARRIPIYSAQLYSTLSYEEQSYADSLLLSWSLLANYAKQGQPN